MTKRKLIGAILLAAAFLLNSRAYAGPNAENAMEQTLSAYSSTNASPLKVTIVNREFSFVVINQGLGGGLKMGENLKVLRQGQEIAMAKIVKLDHMHSVADLIEMDPKQPVVEGDEVQKV